MTRMLVWAAALTLLALGAGPVLAAEVNLQKLSAEEVKASARRPARHSLKTRAATAAAATAREGAAPIALCSARRAASDALLRSWAVGGRRRSSRRSRRLPSRRTERYRDPRCEGASVGNRRLLSGLQRNILIGE